MSQHGCPERLSNRSKGFDEGANQPTMEVLVETLTGTLFEMTVSPSDTIFAIKSKICRVEGIPVSQQHLLYNLRELEDSVSLRAHGITDGARLRLVLGMRGGPFSTRRLPPPPGEPWRDIERLLDTSREESEWVGSGGGCKVTVLVFRDGERVNMLRVRENRDGTYSPIDHHKYSSSLTHLPESTERVSGGGGGEVSSGGGGGTLAQNVVTMGKMVELRRRMHSLSVRRAGRPAGHQRDGDKAEIQKTRSEETLSVSRLLDEGAAERYETEDVDAYAPFYDAAYARLDYDCSFTDRYTLLPPIGARTDSNQSVQEAVAESELKLSDALAGSILVQGRRDEESAILEECLDGEECHIRQDSPAAKSMAPIPAEYGPLVVGEGGVWGARTYGSSSHLCGGGVRAGRTPAHAHSASSLHRAHHPAHPAPLSSSTSDLETLTRNRILPALSRHRNREHLHLSDEHLHLEPAPAPAGLEAGSERRQRRIEKIAEMDSRRLTIPDVDNKEPETAEKAEPKEKKIRIRCGLCRKKLSIATVHRCRCGAEFCAPHRYAEVHGCAYDYKASAHQYLQRANPLVSAPKLPKI